jgi:hypothetical protein
MLRISGNPLLAQKPGTYVPGFFCLLDWPETAILGAFLRTIVEIPKKF